MGIEIGPLRIAGRVFLAPMSGVSDLAFRICAHDCGAPLVFTEMVASEDLLRARADVMRRAAGARRIRPLAIQLAGREARWMGEAARIAQDLGADLIDINMGCPARQVTGGLSGSALMRDPEHALSLVEATVRAAHVPVTLKMRLGWDHGSINAPQIARSAEAAGVRMITVHGRTRCQFYSGRADWRAVRDVVEAVSVPVIVNGDVTSAQEARDALRESGAAGVMIGRGAYGRPWWPAVISRSLNGQPLREPDLAGESALVTEHYDRILAIYGVEPGRRIARKHLGWYLARLEERGYLGRPARLSWHERLMREDCPVRVMGALKELYSSVGEPRACAA